MMLEKVLKRFWEEKFKLFLIVIIAVQFLLLDVVPAGFNHDEIEKIASVGSFIINGTDISGVSLPKALISTNTQGGQNNFPVLILTIFFRFIPLNVTTARIPIVLIGVGSAYLLSQVTYLTTKKKDFSNFVLIVSLLSPWVWFLNRSITEASFSLFFVLLGIYLVERLPVKKRFIAVFPFLFALLSYWGTLAVVPLVSFIVIFRKYLENKKNVFDTVIVPFSRFFCFLLLFCCVLLFTKDSTFHTRGGELIFQNINRYQTEVNALRRQSILNPISFIIVNKYTLVTKDFLNKYISVLSPDFLFIKGDSRATYQFGTHGMMYLLDIPLVFLGIVYLVTRRTKKGFKRLMIYALSFIILGPLGSALNRIESSYVFRSVLFLPGVLILSAAGFCEIQRYSRKFLYITSTVYFFLFVIFLNFFLFQYSIAHQENQFWSEDVVASYIKRVPPDARVTVVTAYPIQLAEKYLFYKGDLLDKNVTQKVYSLQIQFENISFVSNCDAITEGTVIVQTGLPCNIKMSEHSVIENNADSGSLWNIYNDILCDKNRLTPYRADQQFNDYRLYNEDTNTFCLRQIHKYD